jgi:hypothetical protein
MFLPYVSCNVEDVFSELFCRGLLRCFHPVPFQDEPSLVVVDDDVLLSIAFLAILQTGPSPFHVCIVCTRGPTSQCHTLRTFFQTTLQSSNCCSFAAFVV